MNEFDLGGRILPEKKRLPYLRGMDFDDLAVRQNPLLHVRMFHGNLCNLYCRYCFSNPYFTKSCENYDDILAGDEHFNSIIRANEKLYLLKKIKENFGTETVLINGKGEPTIEKDLPVLIRGIHRLGMIPVLATNGTTLNSHDAWKFFYDNNVSLIVKMNSFADKKLESSTFGLNQNSNRYKTIRDITESKEGLGWIKKFGAENRIAFNCVLMRETAGKEGAESVLRFCRDTGVIPWFDWHIATGRGEIWQQLNQTDKQNLQERLNEIDRSYGYDYKLTEDMNLGCNPGMNQNFFQITDHGRIFFTPKMGRGSSDCDKRIELKCFDCYFLDQCIESTISKKLKCFNLNRQR